MSDVPSFDHVMPRVNTPAGRLSSLRYGFGLAGSTIHTDGARMLRTLATKGYQREYVVGMRAPDPAEVLPGVHITASLLKRWLTGTMHFGVQPHQLPYYLDEFTFRFNRRRSRSRGMVFHRVLELAVAHAPVRYTDLVLTQRPVTESENRRPPTHDRSNPPSLDRLPASRPRRRP